MSKYVSSCCGESYEEDVPTCADCGSYDIREQFMGDEGWTICDDCGSVEGGYNYVYVCNNCDETFTDPVEDYEYSEQMKESIAEDRADEERDMR